MYKLVLFDVGSLLVRDSKDISEYMSESIRNIYGRIVTVDLKDYQGWTSQNIAEDVLRKDSMDEEEIKAKLHRITEDLYYTYYNVAGHDKLILNDGARDLLGQIWKKNITMGMVTGETEKIARFRAEKATIHGFFKTGAFAGDGKEYVDIVNKAAEKAASELGVNKTEIAVVANSPHLIKGAKAAGVATIGIANGSYSEEDLRDAGADLAVKSIKDRPKILSFLDSR